MSKIHEMHRDIMNSTIYVEGSDDGYPYLSGINSAAMESEKVTEQIAIEFADWIGFYGWNFNANNKCWWNISDIDFFPTTKELFQEFLKTKQ